MQESRIEPTELLQSWELPGVTGCTQPRPGTNNKSWRVETARTRIVVDAYVLRVYRNAVTPQRITFEHRILQQRSLAALDFAVPEPLPTRGSQHLGRLSLCATVQSSCAALRVGSKAHIQLTRAPQRSTCWGDARTAGRGTQHHLYR